MSRFRDEAIWRIEQASKQSSTSLNLNGLELINIPSELWELTDLLYLDLGNNYLHSLPSSICKLTQLETLFLYENKLTSLPKEICALENLVELHLHVNTIYELPEDIDCLKSLKSLNITRNKLRALPPKIGRLSHLKWLNACDNSISSLPNEIGNIDTLQVLTLRNNQINTFPSQACKLSNLKVIDLSNNSIRKIATNIDEMRKLEELDLSNNCLEHIPKNIGQLLYLRKLILNNNQISKLPENINNLSNLTVLHLSNNRLSHINNNICQLKSLQYLNISKNNISELPKNIGALSKLAHLNIGYNIIDELPLSIAKIEQLDVFTIEPNPLRYPPAEVLLYGSDAALKFIRNISKEGRPRYEAKLLILGDGNEGKTCVSRALRGEPFIHQSTTRGMEVIPWTFNNPDQIKDVDSKITLNIWDFEGQEISHQSHQFFLTKRSLYVVVFNGLKRFDINKIEYWLDTIRSRAPKSNVTLVATHCEERVPIIPLDRLKRDYPDLLSSEKFFFAVGCENDRNVAKLRNHIQNQSTQLEVMGEYWPKNLFDAEKMIRSIAKNKPNVKRKELYEIFDKSGVSKGDYYWLSCVLGDTGTITQFPDTPELKDFVVLKPQWLTKAISIVLENDYLINHKGECSKTWLRKTWDMEYPDMYQLFYYCMREFELIYPLETNPEICLIPLRFAHAIPKTIPWERIDGIKERRISYKLGIRPPFGIMSRFIVKTHHMIHKTNTMPMGVYWYDGVFLRDGEGDSISQALCEFNKDERTLTITV